MGRRIAFMGSPDFAVSALASLDRCDVEVVGVITQPDRPAGRGQALRPPPVKVFAEQHGLPVHQPRRIRKGRLSGWLKEREVDLAVVAAYGRLLPDDVLEAPTLGCVNLHASLLPRWRGASPIHRAIAAGDRQSGVCLMRVVAELDAGPVLARVAVTIANDDTAASLHDKLAAAGADLLGEHLDDLLAGRLRGSPQDHQAATFAPPLVRQDGRLDWRRPADGLHRHVRAMTPWPGAWTVWPGQTDRWKVFADGLQVVPDSGRPGTVLRIEQEAVIVACGVDALRIARLQRPGKRLMAAAAALRGARRLEGEQWHCDGEDQGPDDGPDGDERP